MTKTGFPSTYVPLFCACLSVRLGLPEAAAIGVGGVGVGLCKEAQRQPSTVTSCLFADQWRGIDRCSKSGAFGNDRDALTFYDWKILGESLILSGPTVVTLLSIVTLLGALPWHLSSLWWNHQVLSMRWFHKAGDYDAIGIVVFLKVSFKVPFPAKLLPINRPFIAAS